MRYSNNHYAVYRVYLEEEGNNVVVYDWETVYCTIFPDIAHDVARQLEKQTGIEHFSAWAGGPY